MGCPVPEFIDPVFTKTSPKRSFSLNRKRAFWLVFAKTGSIISGTGMSSFIFKKFVSASRKLLDVLKNYDCLKFALYEFYNFLTKHNVKETGSN